MFEFLGFRQKKIETEWFGKVELVTNNWGSSHMVGGPISILRFCQFMWYAFPCNTLKLVRHCFRFKMCNMFELIYSLSLFDPYSRSV